MYVNHAQTKKGGAPLRRVAAFCNAGAAKIATIFFKTRGVRMFVQGQMARVLKVPRETADGGA